MRPHRASHGQLLATHRSLPAPQVGPWAAGCAATDVTDVTSFITITITASIITITIIITTINTTNLCYRLLLCVM